MKVLIVDDEEDIGMMVSKFLINEGLEVVFEARIEAARNQIASNEFGLCFLDLNLPDGTGFDLIEDIRQKSDKAKIIVISAHDGVQEMKRAKEMEVDLFIKKPFTKRQVIEAVHAMKS
ncbi:MAG: response regulator [Reichenbachiella sp.]|uniref:response regulator n=1 Tax=Reichenbachiella sp. TaxID=2184521 RepID=UPI003263BF88